jgi:signal transduction histidine kinase
VILSAVGAVVVFILIFRAAQTTVRVEIESTVLSEQQGILAGSEDQASLVAAIQSSMKESAGTFYALTAPNGAMISGNLAELPKAATKWQGWQTIRTGDGVTLPPHISVIRGFATRLPDGGLLYVAENASALHALNDLIRRAFVGVFGTIFLLGIIGGLLAARSTLKRVEMIAVTSEEIMSGDLSRRMPTTGANDEFERLTASLNVMLDRIQTLMENIRHVTNDISHDLRTPLRRLRDFLELARSNVDDASVKLIFDEAVVQVDTALSIFMAMLRIAEIESGARRGAWTIVDLSQLLNDLVDTYEAVAETEGKFLSATISPGLLMVGDPDLLTQMFVNVVENSFRHCPMGTRISVTARLNRADDFEVIIADNGPGIPKQDRSRVFQRFVRLDSASNAPGSGLGLALVAAIAAMHDGTVALEDNMPGLRLITRFPKAATEIFLISSRLDRSKLPPVADFYQSSSDTFGQSAVS